MPEVPHYDVHEEVQVDPRRTALLIIDMQNDFVKQGGTLLVPDAEATIPTIQRLRARARARRPRRLQPRHARRP
jgi:nicotinamidase-related amidase